MSDVRIPQDAALGPMINLLCRALNTAHASHLGQLDKSGEAYILHPLRVMRALIIDNNGDQDGGFFSDGFFNLLAVGLLHDVVEDTPMTIEILSPHFPCDVVDAIDAISRRDGETYSEYIERVAANPIATRVKIADIHDNLLPSRALPPTRRNTERITRYRVALRILEECNE